MRVPIGIESSRQCDPLFLSARQIDTPLADLGVVRRGKGVQIFPQATRVHSRVVALGLVRLAKKNVFSESCVQYPSLLAYVSARAIPRQLSGCQTQLSQSSEQQARFSTAHVSTDSY